MNQSSNYIKHLHAFRGFAILNVVGAHAWSFMIFWTGGLTHESLNGLFWFTETLFHGSTLYFAIISGLLFSQVLEKRGWQVFYESKLTNVLMPYVVVSLFLTAFYWQYLVQNPSVNNSFLGYLEQSFTHLLTGKADIHFWYIPVLLALFLVTPVLAWLVNRALPMAVLVALLPLIISRSPFPDFIKPQTFVYFIGAYTLGMLIGKYYTPIMDYVKTYKWMLTLITVAVSITLYMLYVFQYQVDGVNSLRQTLVYIQKVSMSLLVLYWFSANESRLPEWLLGLGTYAFTIFFLHVIFIGYVINAVRPILSLTRTVELITLFGTMNFLAGILGSVITAYLMKKCLGRHSRKLVGV